MTGGRGGGDKGTGTGSGRVGRPGPVPDGRSGRRVEEWETRGIPVPGVVRRETRNPAETVIYLCTPHLFTYW